MDKLFDKVIASNKLFFKKAFPENVKKDILLYEAFYKEEQLIYGVSKVALSISSIKNLTPVCMLPIKSPKKTLKFIKSINPNFINTRKYLLFSFIKHFWSCLNYFFFINNKRDLIDLSINGVKIGRYIYDALLRRYTLPEITQLDFKIRRMLLLEILHFYYFDKITENKKIKMVVLGDNVYRYGLMYELCKRKNIPCIAAISLNGFTISRSTKPQDFESSCRKIPHTLVEQIMNNPDIERKVADYFQKRMSGNIEQHDVISAYKGKLFTNKENFISKYKLDPSLPIVTVMAHIFCDAPHADPGILYDDYRDWLVNTVQCLKDNPNVNILVKEHPSAHLYNEEGVLLKLLTEISAEQFIVDKNESTRSILENSDVIVTCGGTIGAEFSSLGKQVVLASNPPYSNLGFTVEPKSRVEYEHLLKTDVQNHKALSIENRRKAMATAYIYFELYDNYNQDIEIGSEKILLGRQYDNAALYNRIIETNKIELSKQKVYQLVSQFLDSPYNTNINLEKLNQFNN